MPSEKIYAEWTGGMQANVAVDKIADNECLLLDNAKITETGNVTITGASTKLNPTVLAVGTNSTIYGMAFNPSIGAVVGCGDDIFTGLSFGSLSDQYPSANPNHDPLSFASAPNRIYFDASTTGYWIDDQGNAPLLVDWAPPVLASPTTTGPTIVGTGTTSSTGAAWTNVSAVAGTTTYAVSTLSAGATANLIGLNPGFSLGTSSVQGIGVTFKAHLSNVAGSFQDYSNSVYEPGKFAQRSSGVSVASGKVVLVVSIIRGGATVGTTHQYTLPFANTSDVTVSLGGVADLWGSSFAAADLNANTFGVQIYAYITGLSKATVNIQAVKVTAYQAGAGGLVVGTGTTGTLTGTYKYRITNVAINGEESDLSPTTTGVVLSAQMGTLTAIPAGDARTAGRNIYRQGGALSTFYLVGQIPDNYTTTFADNLTDSQTLINGIIAPGLTPGDYSNTRFGLTTQARFPCLHYDRVFWADQNQPNRIFWSKPLNGFAYPAFYQFTVGDSKPITGLISKWGILVIVKTDSIWILSGSDENSFDLQQSASPVGTDMPYTIAPLNDRIIFTNVKGIWVFNGTTSIQMTSKLDAWFAQLDRTNRSLFGRDGFVPIRVDDASITRKFSAAASSSHYYLAYAENGVAVNNAILVFDIKNGTITKRSVLVNTLVADPLTGFVYGGTSFGSVVKLDDWDALNAFADNDAVGALGNPVNFDFQTKYFDLDARGSNLSIWGLEFNIQTTGQDVTPTVYFDYGAESETLASINTLDMKPVFRPLKSERSRKAKNFSVLLNADSSAVNFQRQPSITLAHIKVTYDIRSGRARTGQ